MYHACFERGGGVSFPSKAYFGHTEAEPQQKGESLTNRTTPPFSCERSGPYPATSTHISKTDDEQRHRFLNPKGWMPTGPKASSLDSEYFISLNIFSLRASPLNATDVKRSTNPRGSNTWGSVIRIDHVADHRHNNV